MATTADFITYVCDRIASCGEITSRKMFGEYMVYVNAKPVLLVCDNAVYVKMLEPLANLFAEAQTGLPYKGAKEHYILDIDNTDLCLEAVRILEQLTPAPKRKKKKEADAATQ